MEAVSACNVAFFPLGGLLRSYWYDAVTLVYTLLWFGYASEAPVMNDDTPSSRPRLVFDDPFRIVGYVGEPTDEVGVLLWSGIDPYRYFKRGNKSEIESFRHLLTLDYAGQVVAWQSLDPGDHEHRWSEAPQESMDRLNDHIRSTEPLRYRLAQPPAPSTP